ncbi:MAG TPA: ATPase [Devosia sp.]|nr:ATPase [Devosia sp.]
MTVQRTKLLAPIIREVVVNASPQRAFEIFVQKTGNWWPVEHSLVQGRKDVIIEPFPGGRWYELGENDTQYQWGEVVEAEPGKRLLISWQLSDEWEFDPGSASQVEVVFTVEGDKTRVTLTHRDFENMGPKADDTYKSLSADFGWTSIFDSYSKLASGT